MFSRQFREQMAVVVVLRRSERDVLSGAVVTHVDHDTLWLDAPHPRQELRHLEPGTHVRIRGSDRTGTWFADTEVLDTVRLPLAFRLAVRRPSAPTPERRSYFREPVHLPVHFVLLGPSPVALDANTLELGGNGLRAVAHLPVPSGTVVDVTLPVPGQGVVTTRGRVVRCDPTPAALPHFVIAVRFEGIADSHQQRIVGWLHEIVRTRREPPA